MFSKSLKINQRYIDDDLLDYIMKCYYVGDDFFNNIDKKSTITLKDKIKIAKILMKRDLKTMRREERLEKIESIKKWLKRGK